jgi:hypothetical protein
VTLISKHNFSYQEAATGINDNIESWKSVWSTLYATAVREWEAIRTIVYQNVRAMTLDPEVYLDAEIFDPDRYIPKEKSGSGELFPVGNFGFGRR